MDWIAERWWSLAEFFELGGGILIVIFGNACVMWVLIGERFLFYRQDMPTVLRDTISRWKHRDERASWSAQQVRRLEISLVDLQLRRYLGQIQVLVVLCPLLGLLGTTTGMIEVFEVMVTGLSDPRAVASGVSKAMITTMAGLVIGLAGVFVVSALERYAGRTLLTLESAMELDDVRS